METPLRARLQVLLAEGRGEGSPPWLPLATLESGARYGLDGDARWILSPPDEGAVIAISAANVHLYHEALEQKRDGFEEALERSAKAHELPVDDVVFSFPAVELARAVMAKRVSYLTHLALMWLRTTELRVLRDDILAVTRDPTVPGPVKSLAERLVVPL
jgi:hypothetical protein